MSYPYADRVDYRLMRPKTDPPAPNNREKSIDSPDFAETMQKLWMGFRREAEQEKQQQLKTEPGLTEQCSMEAISKRLAESRQIQDERVRREENDSMEKRWEKVLQLKKEREQSITKQRLSEHKLRNRLRLQKQTDLRRQQERIKQTKIEERVAQAKIVRERQIAALLNLIASLKQEMYQQGFNRDKAAQLDQLKLELDQVMGINKLNLF